MIEDNKILYKIKKLRNELEKNDCRFEFIESFGY